MLVKEREAYTKLLKDLDRYIEQLTQWDKELDIIIQEEDQRLLMYEMFNREERL